MKFKHFRSKGKSVYRVWLFSYICIFLILIFISLIFYSNAVKYTNGEMRKSEAIRLEYIRENMDKELLSIQSLQFKLSIDSNIRSLACLRAGEGLPSEYYMKNVIESFLSYREPIRNNDEFYIWFNNIDLCLTSSSKYSKDYFKKIFVDNKKLFIEDDLNYFQSGILKNKYIIINHNSQKTMASVLFMYTSANSKSADAVIVIPLKSNAFYQNNDVMSGYHTLIADDENEIIFNCDDIKLNKMNFEKSNDLSFSGRGKNKVVYSFINSDVNSWKYIVVLEYSKYAHSISSLKRVLFLTGFLLFLAAIFITMLLLNKNYRPISEILNILPDGKKDKNEFLLIKENITSLMDENTKINRLIDKNEVMLKNMFVSSLVVNESINENNIEGKLRQYDIKLYSDKFCVIIYYVDDAGVLKYNAEDDNSADMVEFVIRNVVEELANSENKGFVAEVSGMMCLVLCFDEKKDNMDTVREIVSQSMEFFDKYYNFSIKVSLGNIVSGISNISKSYKFALSNLERVFYDSDEKIIDASVIPIQEKTLFMYEPEIEKQLTAHIKSGNFNGVVSVIDEIYDYNIENLKINEEMEHMLRNELLVTSIKAVQSLNNRNNGAFNEDIQSMFNMLKSNDTNGYDNITDILKRVCDYVNANKKSYNNAMYEKILQYINENFCNSELNSQQVADKFNITPNYFLRFFKENSGQSFIDYLHKLRIGKAKELLKNSNDTIYSICFECGYQSQNTFIRAFSKITGVSPKKYRDSC